MTGWASRVSGLALLAALPIALVGTATAEPLDSPSSEIRPPHRADPAPTGQTPPSTPAQPADGEDQTPPEASAETDSGKARDTDEEADKTPDKDAPIPAHQALRETDFDFSACQLAFYLLGGKAEPAPAVSDDSNRDCGIDRPLMVHEVLPGVTLNGTPLMRCRTAYALARWMRDFVQPAATRLPGAPRVTALEPGSTYQCRGMIGSGSDAISEHALGNAFDIAAFDFDDGSHLEVAPLDDGSAQQAFLAAVRGAACMDFATVLGPGSNAAHEDHLHLDIKARRNGYRVCE